MTPQSARHLPILFLDPDQPRPTRKTAPSPSCRPPPCVLSVSPARGLDSIEGTQLECLDDLGPCDLANPSQRSVPEAFCVAESERLSLRSTRGHGLPSGPPSCQRITGAKGSQVPKDHRCQRITGAKGSQVPKDHTSQRITTANRVATLRCDIQSGQFWG